MAEPPLPPAPNFRSAIAADTAPATEVLAPRAEQKGLARRSGKLEPWMAAVAARKLEKGCAVADIVNALGISKSTFTKWLQEGAEPDCRDELKVEFSAACRIARSKGAEMIHDLILGHAQTDGKVALRFAEAFDPDVWSPQSKMKVEVEPPAPAEDFTGYTDEEFEVLQKADEIRASKKALPA